MDGGVILFSIAASSLIVSSSSFSSPQSMNFSVLKSSIVISFPLISLPLRITLARSAFLYSVNCTMPYPIEVLSLFNGILHTRSSPQH